MRILKINFKIKMVYFKGFLHFANGGNTL